MDDKFLRSLTAPLTELDAKTLDKKNQASLRAIIKQGANKKEKVLQFIEQNPLYPLRDLVENFNLDWSLDKEFNNGISRIVFYTGEDQRTQVMVLHLPTSEWFR